HQADLDAIEAGEAGAVMREVVEVPGRDALRARAAVHVDELREEDLDPPALRDLPDLFEPRVRGDGHAYLLFGEPPGCITRYRVAVRVDFSTSRGRLCVGRGRPERGPEAHHLHGDLDHQPVVAAE